MTEHSDALQADGTSGLARPNGHLSLRVGNDGVSGRPGERSGVSAGASVSEAGSLLAVIERAALDPNVDIDKMERLYAMYERAAARSSKAAYISAMADMQKDLPVITKRGTIDHGEAKQGKKALKTRYALWEDVVEDIRPALEKHGFALSFRITQPTPDRIVIAGILGHREGHSEETSMALPIDNTGAKNNVQGWGSSVSYGKRYVAFAMLNLVARGEDNDGALGDGETISEEQEKELRDLIDAKDAHLPAFCGYFKIEKLSDLRVADLERAKAALNKKGARNG